MLNRENVRDTTRQTAIMIATTIMIEETIIVGDSCAAIAE